MTLRRIESKLTFQSVKDSSIQSFSPNKFETDYELTSEVLDKDKRSVTLRGVCRDTGESVCVRQISTDQISPKNFRRIIEEFKVLRSLKHDHIVAVRDIYDMGNSLWVVSEYMKGNNLGEKLLDETFNFMENDAAYVITVLCKTLTYCLKKKIVHRNITPENIFFSSVGTKKRLKLAGFDWSKQLERDVDEMSTYCGTPHFTAPEILAKTHYNFKCDVWSLGVVFYLMLSGGYLPFNIGDKEPYANLFEKIRTEDLQFLPLKKWDRVSIEAKDLVKKMLSKSPSERPTYEQILSHKFFKTKAAQHLNGSFEGEEGLSSVLRSTEITVASKNDL